MKEEEIREEVRKMKGWSEQEIQEYVERYKRYSVSDQPRAAAVPRQKGLRRIEGEECHL